MSRWLSNDKRAAPVSTYKERLEAELQILDKTNYSGYFLIVADYVQWAKDNGIAVGPGRGSGPCSLVGFALGITNIDPIKYALPFERFVNPERSVVPDFDLDFCAERRGEVSHYIQSRYGADRVAQLSSDTTTPLPSRLVIGDRPLAQLVPLYPNPETGFPVAKISLARRPDAGLVQFNVINQKALTVIQKTVLALANRGVMVDIENIALDDRDTYRCLSRGQADDIAWLENEHFNAALLAIQPDRFEDLYAAIALSYPGLRAHIPRFAKFKRNPKLRQALHPALECFTTESYGLVLYQEQVMHIAHNIAGFSFAKGDLFRRVLKRANDEQLPVYKCCFIAGAMDFGLSRSEAATMFDQIAFAGRGCVNKSHAVCFAVLAYQIAWLQSHYPKEYKLALCYEGGQ